MTSPTPELRHCQLCDDEYAEPFWIHTPEQQPGNFTEIYLCITYALPLRRLARTGRVKSILDIDLEHPILPKNKSTQAGTVVQRRPGISATHIKTISEINELRKQYRAAHPENTFPPAHYPTE